MSVPLAKRGESYVVLFGFIVGKSLLLLALLTFFHTIIISKNRPKVKIYFP